MKFASATGQARHHSNSSVVFENTPYETRLYERASLRAAKSYSGPAVIAEYSGTTVVPPGWEFMVDKSANMILWQKKNGRP